MSLQETVLANASEIRRIAQANRMERPRLFGSVARRQDGDASDIDILVDAGELCDLFDVAAAQQALSGLLGRPVDVRTIEDLHPKMRPEVLAEAIDL